MGVLLVAICLVVLRWDASPHNAISGWGTGIVFITYFLWAHISFWTCAFNTEKRAWGYAARSYAVVIVVYYFVGILANHGTGVVEIRQVLPRTSQ
jgi:hypothetical protein